MVTIKYNDETDRAYGLSGMVICMDLLDNERYLDSVSIEAAADEGMKFTPDFYQISNQNLSAKAVWNSNLNHFRLITGLMVSNILCRALVKNHEEVSLQINDIMLNYIMEEGRASCALDDDEIRDVYTKTYGYFYRAFRHPQVAILVKRLAQELTNQRKLERETIMQLLSPINN